MPRKILATWTLDDVEDEILFTVAALKADPDAVALVGETEHWLPMIDAARTVDRQSRQAKSEADAARAVANARLDIACTAFGDELNLDAHKDRQGARFQQFFPLAVNKFVRQGLPRQAARVRAWFGSTDPVLVRHKHELERWCTAAEKALKQTDDTALVRGQSHMSRERLAEDLTRERDGLHAALVAVAHEKGLARDWPDAFFRTESHPHTAGETPGATPEGPAASAASPK